MIKITTDLRKINSGFTVKDYDNDKVWWDTAKNLNDWYKLFNIYKNVDFIQILIEVDTNIKNQYETIKSLKEALVNLGISYSIKTVLSLNWLKLYPSLKRGNQYPIDLRKRFDDNTEEMGDIHTVNSYLMMLKFDILWNRGEIFIMVIVLDIAKHNTGVCEYAPNINSIVDVFSIQTINDYINYFKKWENKEIELIIEISNNFIGKYNSFQQNQILGVIYTLETLYNIKIKYHYVYPLEWLKFYPELKDGKKYPKNKRKNYNEWTKLLKNDDEVDAYLMTLVYKKIINKTKKDIRIK